MQFKSPFLQELHHRGFLHQCTNLEGLDTLTAQKSISFYVGYDATAPSLHVGNLMSIMLLRIGQRHGHTPIVIMGGATTRLGDPTWKDTERPLLEEGTIKKNISTIKGVFKKYLNFQDGSNKALLLNNDDWFAEIKYLDMLREVGRFISVNRMMTFDSVRMRLEREQPLTFLEFNYMVFQSYDFLHLNKKFDCVLQCGGSDQWGNIVSGVDLIRRINQKEAFGLTSPLLTTAGGQKMGKTEKGAVWLNAESLSAYDYWQFWRNVEDADVLKLIKIYTDVPVTEIESYKGLSGSDLNKLKIRLADEATTLAHGPAVLADIHATVQKLFQSDAFEVEVSGYDEKGNPILKSSLPIFPIGLTAIKEGVSLIQLLVQSGLATSNGEARRLVRGNGCAVNGEKVVQEDCKVTEQYLQTHNVIRLSAGKKNHALIQGIK
ncbi:MAG: tyrosine--tRNA ligase [Alphaproteobacteria bacterium]